MMEGLEKQLAEAVERKNAELMEQVEQLKGALADGVKAEDLEGLKSNIEKSNEELRELVAKQQEQFDDLSTKFTKAQSMVVKQEVKRDPIASIVKDNFEAISKVKDNTSSFQITLKDMTLPVNLTGDQPRDYNDDVVRRRPQGFINVTDLARTFPIAGGTYTYTRSTKLSGDVATQTEGSAKAQLEYSYAMVDANTDFIAGFAVYSRKMRNNLPWMESTLGLDLRDDYWRGENAVGQTILAAEATASTQVITGQNKIEMIIAEFAALAGAASNAMPTAIVMTPADYYDILITEKSTGAGYGLPGIVTYENGTLRVQGVPVYIANWLPANKYYVGNFERFSQPVTEGLSFSVSQDDSDNFRKNNITARIEQQTTFAVERPSDIIYGDFTAT